jgi:hypothetical protein
MSDDPFRAMRTPRPGDDLKGRVLRAARGAAAGAPRPARAPWGFTRLDLVWVAALLLLAVANLTLTRSNRPSEVTSASSDTLAVARQLERELGFKGPLVVAKGWDRGEDGKAQMQLMRELERL